MVVGGEKRAHGLKYQLGLKLEQLLTCLRRKAGREKNSTLE